MTNPSEQDPSSQNFRQAPVPPEVAAARDALSVAGNNLIDWCLAHPDLLPPTVHIQQMQHAKSKRDVTMLHINMPSIQPPNPDSVNNEGGFLIVHRTALDILMSPMQAGAEDAPFGITRSFPGELPTSWRKISTIIPESGRPRVETAYEQEKIIPPGMITYKPIEPYSGRPANAADLTDEHITLDEVAKAAGLPPEAFESQPPAEQ